MRPHALLRLVLPIALVCAAAPALEAGPSPLVHLQTDKPSYRLGDAVWFRVHAIQGTPERIEIALLRDNGGTVATKVGTPRPELPLEGMFVIPEELPGGTWKIVARSGERVLHEIKLDVYDVTVKTFDLELEVLAESVRPGDDVTATFAARDRQGHALVGEVAHWTARFGPLTVSGTTSALDDEGRAVIHFQVPEKAQTNGNLSVGVESQKVQGAIARPVRVFAGIARLDAFPEGGSIVPGGAARVALLARGVLGDALECEGRIVDDLGQVVDAFATGRRGLALVAVPYEVGRSYTAIVDRPAGVVTHFALPGPTGHARAVRIDFDKGVLTVRLRGKHTTGETRIALVTEAGVRGENVTIARDGDEAVARFGVEGTSFGAGHVIVTSNGRAELKTPVVFGDQWAIDVTLTPREPKLLPGELVTVDALVTDHTTHKGITADFAFSAFQCGSGEGGLEDLPIRALLQPFVSGNLSDVDDLFRAQAFGRDERTAYVLMRGGFQYPVAGVALEKSGLPDANVGRVVLAEIPPPAPPEAPKQGDTVSSGDSLERLMERAPFTRHELARAESDRPLTRIADPAALIELPVKAKVGQLPPQDVLVGWSKVDCRDTLLWKSRVVTDGNGRATFTFRLGHEVSALRLVGEGLSRSGVAIATGTSLGGTGPVVRPTPAFTSQFEFPTHLTIGDQLDLFVTTEINDGGRDAIKVVLNVPPCLKALERTERTFDPRKDERTAKYRFEVVDSSPDARLTVTSTRGLFREIASARFKAARRDIEISCGRSGLESGTQSLTLKVPADAEPGSVSVFSRVVDSRSVGSSLVGSPAGSTIDGNDAQLREPTGCFEQTTSSNYPNLLILSALRAKGRDAAVLQRAMDFCTRGFLRILTFQTAEGSFSLWQGQPKGEARYTAMAIVQLSLYGKLFGGKGSLELNRAVRWLEKNASSSDDSETAFMALSSAESGIMTSAFDHSLGLHPKTNYARALLANFVVEWKREWPLAQSKSTFLQEIVAPLAAAIDPQTGRLPSETSGIMGSTGDQLDAETAALAAVALHSAGFAAQSHACMKFILSLKSSHGNVVGTRANAVTLRALDRLGLDATSFTDGPVAKLDPVLVQFFAPGLQALTGFVGDASNRPATFDVPVSAAPGSTVSIGLDMKTTTPLEYGLGLRYRVATPIDSAAAPYTLTTRIDPVIVATDSAAGPALTGGSSIEVKIAPTGRLVEGQVVCQVALPGGCVLGPGGVKAASLVETRDGAVLLYFEKPPTEALSISIPIMGRTAGNFVTGPSVIYPYYATGREAYAPSLATKVLPAFDAGLAVSGAAQPEKGGLHPAAPAAPAPSILHR